MLTPVAPRKGVRGYAIRAGLRQAAHRPRDGRRALQADAIETWVCSYLSLALLLGVGAYAVFGWTWADPVGALLMLPVVLWQGWEPSRTPTKTTTESLRRVSLPRESECVKRDRQREAPPIGGALSRRSWPY
jgi:hypothetical protein